MYTYSIAKRLFQGSFAFLLAAAMLTAGCADIEAGLQNLEEDIAKAEAAEEAREVQEDRAEVREEAREHAEEVVETEQDEPRGFLDRVERAFEPEPETVVVTVPAGSQVPVSLSQTLSSHESQAGQPFQAQVVQDIAEDGVVVIPQGSTVYGTVTQAQRPKIGGRAKLSLSFDSVELPSGENLPLSASLARVGKSERAKDAAIIGGGTIGGAILGEAVDEGEGTVIGAIVGGLAGAAGAKKTKGKPLTLPAGTSITLSLDAPVTVEVPA